MNWNENSCEFLWRIQLKWYFCVFLSTFFLGHDAKWTGRGGTAGGKFRISLGLPVGAVMNCADNTGGLKVNEWIEDEDKLIGICFVFQPYDMV